MSFPIHSESPIVEPTERMTAQLEQLRSLVLLVKRLFEEREAHIEQMSALITSQHAAVMRLSKNTSGSRDALEQSRYDIKKAQDIIDRDRRSRREFMTFTTPK